jgi:hypothetical protein
MRRLREILRLKFEAGFGHRAIARACGVGLGTVTSTLQRAAAAGVTSSGAKTPPTSDHSGISESM